MPVHMGIMCEVCRKVHFIATSLAIRRSPMNNEMYRLICTRPCREVREFRKDAMRPYRVPDKVFNTGHAQEGDYELVGHSARGRSVDISVKAPGIQPRS